MPIHFGTMKQQWDKVLSVKHFVAQSLSGRILLGLVMLCALAFVACSDGEDDSGHYIPPYITDMMVANADERGIITTVTLDNGKTYDVAAQQKKMDFPNETMRCIAIYTLQKEKLTLASIAAVFSYDPVPADAIAVVKDGETYSGVEAIPRDPVKLVSAWKSGGYINLHLGVMTTGAGVHQYAFCEDSPGHYSLAHLRPAGDEESYTDHVYMSMPIPDGVKELTFSVYTYDGVYTKTFDI